MTLRPARWTHCVGVQLGPDVRRAFRSVLEVFPIEHLVRERSPFLISKTSTRNQAGGTLHEIRGGAKEKAGHVTNNPKLATKGQAENVAGRVQMKVGQVVQVLG